MDNVTTYATRISDPIFGVIGITDVENKIIHTQVFQRLKNIRQLGTANFVYPGANHSRFEHSIGVMHATSLILDTLNIGQDYKQPLRIAALLHDIGHGPFSHTFEEILRKNPEFAPEIEEHGVLRNHEDFSDYIITANPELVKILGSERQLISQFLLEKECIGSIPPEIVTGDLGSDRLDYLVRDTYYAGMGHRPDINALISNLKLITGGKSPRMGIHTEGIPAAELLITTRYYHFSLIANNPKTRAYELLFLKLALNVINETPNKREFMLKAFTQYDDSIVLSKFYFSKSPQKKLFYSGKSLSEIYNISLNEIRSGFAKYCIYRFFFDTDGLKQYCENVSNMMEKQILSGTIDKITADIDLFKHETPDITLFKKQYNDQKEWISPFAIDHSNILRLIPSEQLVHSNIGIFTENQGVDKEALFELIDQKSRFFLSTNFLSEFSRKRITQKFTQIDYFYTFLSALRDFYEEKNPNGAEELFRGLSRFYKLAKLCDEKFKIKILNLKSFCTGKEFDYSSQGFSILNAFDRLGFLDLLYVPVKKSIATGKPYHKVYYIKAFEKEIRKQLYDGNPTFEQTRTDLLEYFRELDWNEHYKDFFPLIKN